jgi:hypothetical protein
VVELTQQPSGPTLLGGVPADPKEWPVSFYAITPVRCTSTLVGPQALLMAAHCVGHKAVATIRFRDGNDVSAVCTHAPEYATDRSADYALCHLKTALIGAPYEVVNTDPALLRAKAVIVLTGYGCTKGPGKGGNDRIYRVGEAEISALPGADPAKVNYLVTKGKVATCLGDSGGGAFLVNRQSLTRKLVSVNSSGNMRDTSNLSATSTPAARKFLKDWSDENGATICGVSPDAANCR